MSIEQEPDGAVTLFLSDAGLYVRGQSTDIEAVLAELHLTDESGSGSSAVGRAADIGAAGASVAAFAGTAEEYLRLTPAAMERLKEFGAQFDGAGAMRGYVRGEGGKIAGQLTFESVSFGAEQALAMQTAAVSLALRTAIADVQAAVEEVQRSVDDLADRAQAREIGIVVGTYERLQAIADATQRRGVLLSADWDSVSGAGPELGRALTALRSYVSLRIGRVDADDRLPKRERAVKELSSSSGVGGALKLILIAEKALHLWEYLRLERVRSTEPDHVESALEDARTSLTVQQSHDHALLQAATEWLAAVREIDPLEVHRFASIGEMRRSSLRAIEALEEFAAAARAELSGLDRELRRPELSETRAEVKRNALEAKDQILDVGEAAGKAASRGAKLLAEKVRRSTRDDAE